MNVFELVILTAEKPLYEGGCVSLVVPTTLGQYGIQAMHSNLIAAIVPGMLKYTDPDGEVRIAAVSEGLVKVEHNHVLVLVDTAEWPDEIDENRAKREIEQAKEVLLQKRSDLEYKMAQAELARALNRLHVKKYDSE